MTLQKGASVNRIKNSLAGIALVVALSSSVFAYPIRPAITMDEMTDMADLVVKAKVISEQPSSDAALTPVTGFPVQATRFQVLSVIKGDAGGNTIVFRHYAEDQSMRDNYVPQHYEFRPGRSYIFFAIKSDTPGVFRQLRADATEVADEGALLAMDDKPTTKKSVKDACWSELIKLANSPDATDVTYAIPRLDQMSGGGWDGTKTFDRKDVAEAIRPLLDSKNASVMSAALKAAGSGNPYFSPGSMEFWLVTIGHGHLPGLAEWDPKFDNLSGRLLWSDLARIADSHTAPEVRASAIRAMGRSGAADLPAALDRWAHDGQPLVRQAAIVLLGDVPSDSARLRIIQGAHDASAEVRRGAAEAVGIGQITSLVPLLGNLLKDGNTPVRDAAAMSLLSFSLGDSGDLLRANIHDAEYRSVFVNALASSDASPYLADLKEIISKRLEPARFWGGEPPAADSWNILFKYAQRRSADEFRSGKFDSVFDGLESAEWYSSSEPRDLYALYLQHGLTDRARAFRTRCDKETPLDLEYFFKQADQSPDTYKRE